MSTLQFTSLSRIIAKVRKECSVDNLTEGDIIELIGDALSALDLDSSIEERVVFAEVKNYKVQLPSDIIKIQQIAKNLNFNYKSKCDDNGNLICPKYIQEEILECKKEDKCNKCNDECDSIHSQKPQVIFMNPRTCEEVDEDVRKYGPYLIFKWNLGLRSGNDFNLMLRDYFVPVRVTSNTMFKSLLCTDTYSNLDSTNLEYTINQNKELLFNFQEGQIVMSYLATLTDENNLPMIPDNVSVIEAILAYVTFKATKKRFYDHREGSDSRFVKAEKDWHWYCRQAKNSGLLSIDTMEYLKNIKRRFLPNTNAYEQFFKNTNVKEDRSYMSGNNFNINYGRRY